MGFPMAWRWRKAHPGAGWEPCHWNLSSLQRKNCCGSQWPPARRPMERARFRRGVLVHHVAGGGHLCRALQHGRMVDRHPVAGNSSARNPYRSVEPDERDAFLPACVQRDRPRDTGSVGNRRIPDCPGSRRPRQPVEPDRFRPEAVSGGGQTDIPALGPSQGA